MKTWELDYRNANEDSAREQAYMVNNQSLSVRDLPEDFQPFYIGTDKVTGSEVLLSLLDDKMPPEKTDFEGKPLPREASPLAKWMDYNGVKSRPTLDEFKKATEKAKAKAK